MFEELQIIRYPDPRLAKISEPVREFTPALRELSLRMLELMRQARGVGLAAPQVGHNIRLFVMNPTGEPDKAEIFVNPVLSDPDGEDAGEEGCLSLPGVTAQIMRNKSIHLQAQDLEGKHIDQTQSGYIARIWQHEYDHLNGVLITDRMGLGDRLKHRRVLRELQEVYEAEHPQVKTANPKTPVRKKTRSTKLK